MKMTEKMKAVLQEEMAKAGVELSEEELDGVSGGREMTEREKEKYDKWFAMATQKGKWRGFDNVYNYSAYIKSLPDDAPEELYDPCKDYREILYGDRRK